MTDETMPADLWEETRQAGEAWRQAQGRPGEETAEPGPGRAGQVRVLPELGEPRLSWAVLRREEGERERLLLVAADVNPRVGSGDIAVRGPEVGALTLRCRFAVWASDRELRAAPLLGTLPSEALARADSRWQDVEAGRTIGTFSEQETEEDPEYQDWIEDVVRPAAGKLATAASAEARSPLPFPSRRPGEPRLSPRGAGLRWAAVLAFVALGAASGFLAWRQGQEIAGLRGAAAASAAAHRQAIAELEARRVDLEARYQAQLRQAGLDRARLESEHRARLAELEAQLAKLRRTTDVKNPLLATLEPSATQRGTNRVEVGPEVSHILLLLPVKDPAGAEFRVEIYEEPAGKPVFLQKGLRADVRNEVWLGVPAALLPPGAYRLRLLRQEGGAWRQVREHRIDVAEKPRPRPPRW